MPIKSASGAKMGIVKTALPEPEGIKKSMTVCSIIAAHEGISLAECMAFGDGGNDIPILRRAGTGVAMGNAGVTVKAAADYITDNIDAGGVANALRHFGVIQ